jgi:hypothetical protein
MKTYQVKVLSIPTKRGSCTELLNFVVSSETSLREIHDYYDEKYNPLQVNVKEVPVVVLNIPEGKKEEIQDSSKPKVFKNKISCDIDKTLFDEYNNSYKELELSSTRLSIKHQEVQNAIKSKYAGVISVDKIERSYGKIIATVIYRPEEVLTLEEI